MNTCSWAHKEDWDDDYWETSCDNAFVLLSGTPSDNGMKFCPYCGKVIMPVEEYTLKGISVLEDDDDEQAESAGEQRG